MGWHLTTTCVALACALTAVVPRAASAQERSEFRLRTTAAVGLVASKDQWSEYGLDLPVVEASAAAGWIAHDVLTLEARLGGGAFFSTSGEAGGLLDLSLGAELGSDFGIGRAYVALHFGAGVTGDLVRPVLHAAAGLDLHASPEIDLGPVIQYGHLFQEDGTGFSDDAQWLSLGLSMTFSPVASAPTPEPEPAPRSRPRATMPPTPAPALAIEPADDAEILLMVEEAIGIEPRELVVPILFQFDSTEMVACSIASLHSLAEHLREHAEIELLQIEGHADGAGDDAYNQDLSERRAAAVRDWLVAHEVAPDRLQLAARGEGAPIESNDEAAGREQNRRVRFRVIRETSR